MRSEWPANGEIGIRVEDVGKSVLKTLGVQAPDVKTRRVHGTILISEEVMCSSQIPYIRFLLHLEISVSLLEPLCHP